MKPGKVFNKLNVRAWMKQNKSDYVDQKTGELDCTSIVEDCCDHFGQKDIDGPLDDETHWIWDIPLKL